MDSSNPTIYSGYQPLAINEVSFIASPTLNSYAPVFFPYNPYLPCNYYSPPPLIYLLSPPPIFIYYPLWHVNPNPNPLEFIQESPPSYSSSPMQELSPPPASRKRVFSRRRNIKRTWRKIIKYQDESNDAHITTVMLRNIPNEYTREMMIDFMDMHCEEANKNENNEESPPISAYDFFYLPIDFKSGLNRGYAFVNFINKEAVLKFKAAYNHKAWSHCYSRKLLEIVSAKIQGKYELVKHFTKMTYPAEAYGALSFSPARSGPENTVKTIMVGRCIEPMISV
ncbi:protein terminal ear1 [Eutrema salsugineum]|uniref:protein terminal ear1 n=1 Tax=Eutrema salsugineum TaxID=72664 RepID=UPI000CED291C|nr:protein terminal ear1 [Eutrema salsugineum]